MKAWSSDAASLDAGLTTIANLKAQLKTAVAAQRATRQDWAVSTAHMLSTATVFCSGSAEKVTGFGLDVETHQRLGALAAPADLTVNPGKGSGEAVASWTRGNALHGFVVQHATDAGNPASFSAPQAWTKSKFTLSGLATSATVSFRVAAIDPSSPTGQSPWSAWVVGNAR